ncbi:MAG: class B sortase [Oscillospiraceae bacterium]|nr:class B sortase [Oscillospiraceae bacterium]
MPNNEEKKYTLDDILKEYDDEAAAAAKKEAESAASQEVIPAYKNTELFDSDFTVENILENEEDVIEAIMEQNRESEVEEIIADDEDDDIEISEEKFETDTSEAENADIVMEADKSIEEKTIEEIVLEEAALWKNSVDTEELTETEAAALIPEQQEEQIEAEVPEEAESDEPKETEAVENETVDDSLKEEDTQVSVEEQEENDTEDVNDKFLKRFLKSLFPWKGDSVGEIIRKIIFLVAVIVFIGAGVMLVSTLMQSQQAVEEKEANQSIITTTVATSIDDEGKIVTIAPTEEEIAEHNFNVAEHFKSINEDYIGYLEVDGCDIYEPIMQGDDNDYYLDHNYYGGTNKAGTVFLDYRCTVSEEYISPNIVFYGHNQEDGTMFGNLKEYKQNVEFYQENPLVKFSPEFETGEYVIYGYFITHVRPEQDSNGEVFHYHDYIEALRDEETFNWYIDEVQKRNQIVSPVDVQYGDKLLCLSTCSNEFSDSRFVIFARRLRDGEKIDDFDFSEAYLNPYAKGVDWEAIMSNETSLTEETTETESESETETESVSETEETTTPEIIEEESETTSDTRRKYKDVMQGKYTTTKKTETENTSEISVSDGEEAPAETDVPSGTDTTEETTVPPETSAE